MVQFLRLFEGKNWNYCEKLFTQILNFSQLFSREPFVYLMSLSSCSPQGNPRLCLSGSCLPSKRKPFPVAIVASVASVASIIIAVLVLIFVFRKKKPSTVGGNLQEKSY